MEGIDSDRLTLFETEQIRIQEQELGVRNAELRLQEEQLRLQRRWYRNPTVISGLVLAYATGLVSMFTVGTQQKEAERQYALEYMKIAIEVLQATPQENVATWANDVMKHFSQSPFTIDKPVVSATRNQSFDIAEELLPPSKK